MNPLVHVLTGRAVEGVWRSSVRPIDAVALVESFGRLALVVDTGGDKTHVLDQFARVGHFPEWVGRNWDALEDALTDLSWLPSTDVVVILDDDHRGLDDRSWSILLDILAGASRTWSAAGRRFSTVVVGDSSRCDDTETALPDLAELG